MAERPGRSAARAIARSEIRRLARDRRALFSAVLLPALIYPLVFHGQAWLQSFSRESMGAQTVRVALDVRGAPDAVATGLERLLRQELPIEIVHPVELGLGEVTDKLRELQPALIEGRPNDRIGLVVFGEEAFTHVPLTLDHSSLLSVLDQVQIGLAGPQGTAVGSAIAVSAKRLKDLEGKKVGSTLTSGEYPFLSTFYKNAGVDASTIQSVAVDNKVRERSLLDGLVSAISCFGTSAVPPIVAAGGKPRGGPPSADG